MNITQTETFQFLYGAIKRGVSFRPPAFVLHFNSSMVRLKAGACGWLNTFEADFNSSMVRLKEEEMGDEADSFLFQFLYGAIKSSVLLTEHPIP